MVDYQFKGSNPAPDPDPDPDNYRDRDRDYRDYYSYFGFYELFATNTHISLYNLLQCKKMIRESVANKLSVCRQPMDFKSIEWLR
ncbi:hypothetical protein ED312_00755 [Sinomicrobium pectinilyticum]|uniref:Uncharacterized protein n=1 Tax=Sinomicrobium pectinilyticum TaxID=1084421 RepID=A0A3N0F5A8_SINP1|nr:hypothetical protein ED312_00755 [Sinomicrobium pectinilyticum]